MKLRSASTTDAEDIAELVASFQSELTDLPSGEGAEQYIASVSAEAERGYLQSSRYSFIVAEANGEFVGFIAMRDMTHVFHLFVARRHQGVGVARSLWEAAKVKAQGIDRTCEFTVNSSLQAVPVYRSFGFLPVGRVISVHGISFQPMRRGNEA